MNKAAYQPVDSMPDGVLVCFSNVADGSVATGGGNKPTSENLRATKAFLEKNEFILPETRIFVTYSEDRTYTDIARVTDENIGNAIPVDALYTTDPNVTISVPVADCVATVVYDPIVRMMCVLHLGRHASTERLIEAFAYEVTRTANTKPENWHVWMSPSLQAAENRMEYFNPPYIEDWLEFQSIDEEGKIHVDVPAHNRDRFMKLGVPADNIYVSPVDTYTDTEYFSHRASVELNDPSRHGRMMVAAMMRE